jgi:hypothetical protein
MLLAAVVGVLAGLLAIAILAILAGVLLNADRTDDLSAEGADEGAWGVVNHDQPNSDREQANHV